MNLNDMLKEGSINSLEWLDEAETFNPASMGLSNEEEMKAQWDKDLKPENKEKIIKRKVNELLNEGVLGKDILSNVKKVFAKQNIPSDISDYVKARSGAVGTVLVDCGNFKDNKDYLKLKKASQFKSFHQYAINCTCDHKVGGKLQEDNVANMGNIDGILNSKIVKAETIKICSKTGLPVLKRMADYSSDDAVNVLAKLVRLKYITVEEEKGFLVNNAPLLAVKKAFNHIVDKVEKEKENKYAEKINNDKHIISENEVVAEIGDCVGVQEVSGINESRIVADIQKLVRDSDIDINKKESSMDMENSKGRGVLDVKISKKRKELDFEKLADIQKPELDVDVDVAENEVELEREFESVDVDGDEYIDREWFDNNEIDATPNDKQDSDDFDIDGRAEFNF